MLLKDRFVIDSTGDEERSRVISYGPCQVIFQIYQSHYVYQSQGKSG